MKKIIPILFLIANLFFYSVMSYASLKSNTQYWTAFNINGTLPTYSNILYSAGYQGNTNARTNDYERSRLFGAWGYQYRPRLSFWLGYQWNSPNFVSGTHSTNRTWEQANWLITQNNHVNILSRTRFEQIMMDEQLSTSLRLRERMTLRLPNLINYYLTPMLYDEIFLNFNNPTWINNTQLFAQNRIFLGMNIQIVKNSNVEIGYISQFIWRNTGNNINHILWIAYDLTTE